MLLRTSVPLCPSVYVDHPEIPLDNNNAEDVVRPFVLGRRNGLFAATQDGAHASPTLL